VQQLINFSQHFRQNAFFSKTVSHITYTVLEGT